MNLNKKSFPLLSLNGMKAKIDPEPDFQRPAVWTKSQKQLLIDTILRGLDVPKLYWRRKEPGAEQYDVVDGQQRLRAIWGYFNDEFRLPKSADPVNDVEVAGLGYSDLPEDLRLQFDNYNLDIVILENTNDDEIRETFLRLQNGTSLKAQEKRNAFSGRMRDFVKDLADHPFFMIVPFKNSRFAYDHTAAQCVCLELKGGPSNVRNADLNRMYESHKDFNLNGKPAKDVRRVFSKLNEVFQEKTPELERYNVIALFCVMSELLQKYVYSEIEPHLKDWFITFERERAEMTLIPADEEGADPEWTSYKERTSHSTDAEESIRFRMEFMMKRLLVDFPDLPLKDARREFSHEQRLAIYRRDGGRCQIADKCDGDRIQWDDWHCDHVLPHSGGGPTTVSNGQVSCSACNLAKSDS